MDDLISRQAAIDQLHQSYNLLDAEQRLEDLSSVQPERKKGEWIDIGGVIRYGCPFCHYAQERKSNFCPNNSTNEWCTDCKEYDNEKHNCPRFNRVIRETVREIQPERKKGQWIKPTGMMPPEYAGVYRCSECDEIAMRDWGNHKQKLSNFCPNCGADLRGDQDDK